MNPKEHAHMLRAVAHVLEHEAKRMRVQRPHECNFSARSLRDEADALEEDHTAEVEELATVMLNYLTGGLDLETQVEATQTAYRLAAERILASGWTRN